MVNSVWYISKYSAPGYAAKAGSRGFNLLRELSKKGVATALFTSDSNHLCNPPKFKGISFNERVDEVEVYWIKTFKYRRVRSVWRILSWLDFETKLFFLSKKCIQTPDVVIVSSLSLLTVLNGLYLKLKYDCKLVFEVRDIWPLVLTSTGGFSEKNIIVILLGYLEKLALRRADSVVGTMPNLTEHVTNVLGYKRRVLCIPQGVDPEREDEFSDIDDAYIRDHVPTDKFIVCHAGSIGADNALETLLECARKLHSNQKIHFLLVGDGDLKLQYQFQCRDLNNISFAPRVDPLVLQSLLRKMHLLYFAMHDNELCKYGQSLNKLTDYMRAGVPVLASFSGYRSMINDAGCGSFVPAANAHALATEILRYSSMPQSVRSEMGLAGRKWILENQSFEKLAGKYLVELQKICRTKE